MTILGQLWCQSIFPEIKSPEVGTDKRDTKKPLPAKKAGSGAKLD
jgi:hypothetical protein